MLSNIPEKEQAEVLATKWLSPEVKYTSGGSFGEKSLNSDYVDHRAGTAVCMTDCQLRSLSKDDYKRFVLKIE